MGVPDTDLTETLTAAKALRNLRVNGLLDEADFFDKELQRLRALIFEEECKRAVVVRQILQYCQEEDD